MSDDSAKETKVSATVDAITGLLKAAPVYQDIAQPSAQQVGKGLEIVTKAVLIGLAPLKMLVWGYEQIEGFITRRVSEKLKNIPPENIITPAAQIAGPAVEALRYVGHEENLRELYANLLATAMDKETAMNAHPGYVEIIKNLTPDEARLLTVFTTNDNFPLIDIQAIDDSGGYITIYTNHSHIANIVEIVNKKLMPNYIDNLCRLGILNIPPDVFLNKDEPYKALENDKDFSIARDLIREMMNNKVQFKRKILKLTNYGGLFVKSVVSEKS